MKPATSNLACSWDFPRPIITSHQKKKWMWPWARGVPQNLGIPYNIFATAGASDFKFCMPLGFVKAHDKITPGGKVGYGNSLKFGVPF